MNSFFPQAKAPMKSQMLIKPLGLSTSFICAMEETASSWATQSNNQDIQSREVILHAIATMGKQPPRNTCAWIQYAAYGHGSWTNHLAANEPNFFGVKKSIQFSNVSIIQVGMNLFPKDLEEFLVLIMLLGRMAAKPSYVACTKTNAAPHTFKSTQSIAI